MGESQIISLNVGGTLYATSKTTIMRCPGSMLAKMVVQGGLPVLKDKADNIFIDRDGVMFRYVLNYLRDGEFDLPASFTGYDQLLREVRFYQLGDQVEELVSTPAVVSRRPNGSRKVEVVVIAKSANAANYHKIATSLPDPLFAELKLRCIQKTSDLKEWGFTDLQWPLVYASVIRKGLEPVSGPPGLQTFVLEEESEQ